MLPPWGRIAPFALSKSCGVRVVMLLFLGWRGGGAPFLCRVYLLSVVWCPCGGLKMLSLALSTY